MKARIALVAGAILLHAAATFASIVFSIRLAFAAAAPGATLPTRGLGVASRALLFPILDPIAQRLDPSDRALYVLIVANSACAIAVTLFIIHVIRRVVRGIRCAVNGRADG